MYGALSIDKEARCLALKPKMAPVDITNYFFGGGTGVSANPHSVNSGLRQSTSQPLNLPVNQSARSLSRMPSARFYAVSICVVYVQADTSQTERKRVVCSALRCSSRANTDAAAANASILHSQSLGTLSLSLSLSLSLTHTHTHTGRTFCPARDGAYGRFMHPPSGRWADSAQGWDPPKHFLSATR